MPFKRSSDSTTEFSLLSKLGNNIISDLITKLSLFPLDLIKTRLQVQRIGPNGERMYKNLFDCFRKVYQKEGFTGMYKGVLVGLCVITPDLAINDFCIHHLKTKNEPVPFYRQLIAGSVAGTVQVIISTPTELLKVQMQEAGVFAEEARKAGIIIPKQTTLKIASKLLRERGFFGLYEGFTGALLRDITFCIVVFPLCAAFTDEHDGITIIAALGSAAFATFIGTPFDVVKTRLQAQALLKQQDVLFTGTLDCIRKTIRNEGIVALFKGNLIRMLVMAPNFGIAKIIYDMNATEKLWDGIKKLIN